MSKFNNSKSVKFSSVERGMKPEDADDASAVEETQPTAGCSQSAMQKTPKDVSETEAAIVNSDTAKGTALVEDVLVLIFETDFLDTADLLQCRLVNRSWRDAATSVLLRSSACQISFNSLSVPVPSTVKFDATQDVYCNNNNNGDLLQDLNEIILQSPKFPCSSFRFVNKYSFGDLYNKDKRDTSSLHNFFSIYGNNVKTITVGDRILKSDFCSLLLNYAPNLKCLDLQYLQCVVCHDTSVFRQPLFPESTILPNLKTLLVGPCMGLNLVELVNAAINLESVETTRVADLKFLEDQGKVGLIKKLQYCLYVYDLEEFSAFEKLAASEPKLTHLIVTAVRNPYEDGFNALPGLSTKLQMFLNRILESSKDTLKYLEFRICPFADIKFPILTSLECLKLSHSVDRYPTTPTSNPKALELDLEDDPDQFGESKANQNFEFSDEVDARIHGICPNRPCGSFPNLQKLQLDIYNYRVGSDGSFLLLQTCRSHNRKIESHVYKSVKVLEIYCALPSIQRAKLVSNSFPNVTILKVKCKCIQDLHCSLWMVSPLAKSIEIYGLSNYSRHCDEEGGDWNSSEDEYDNKMDDVGFVDSFFTGFPIEMCTKLKGIKQIPVEIEEHPSLMNLMRVKPSISDLIHLTDFKILFRQLRAPFASHVSGFYAFRNMPGTKITFAHSEPIKINEAECEMEKYLAPISTFVHFTHRNIPKRFENDKDIDRYIDMGDDIDDDDDDDDDVDIYSDSDDIFDSMFSVLE